MWGNTLIPLLQILEAMITEIITALRTLRNERKSLQFKVWKIQLIISPSVYATGFQNPLKNRLKPEKIMHQVNLNLY